MLRLSRSRPARVCPMTLGTSLLLSSPTQAYRTHTHHRHCCICSGVFNANRKMSLNAMTRPPKKSKAPPADFTEAQRACRTPAEREQLAIVVSDKWTPAELREYARLYF